MPESPPTAADPRRRFISLKWKTLLLVSLALGGIYLVLVVEGYFDSMAQFNARQALAFEQRVSVLRRLLQQSEARLQRIAAVVPGVINTATFADAFGERWNAVQLELGLEVMQLYQADGKLQVAGLTASPEGPPPELVQRIAQALREERPGGFLLCRPQCLQYALIPALGARGERELMVLAVSLADVVLEFPGLAGADVALLVERPPLPGESRYWGGYQLAAISDAPSNEAKVASLAASVGLPALEQGAGLSFGGRSYQFYARRLQTFGSVTPGYFLVFGDTTEALRDIRSQILRQLGGGLTALLAALLLLLSILNRPMNQLRKLAQVLPMLAQQQYEPARRLIGPPKGGSSQTEIEVLEMAAIDLSRKLETLEQTVAARSQALAEKIAELRRAHELNDKIFATAPMLILTQSSDGKVQQINEFGSHLLGYSPSEVRGMSYLSLLADPRQREEALHVLVDVISGRRALFEQTGPVRCVDGGLERVTWLHTRLAAQSGTFVLSVGLPDKSQLENELALH
ncbi:MAG TPA: cache domain-containing protein [Solimonas sp.]|nr:cache domain-containing protein [Solimonas sp.]